MKKRTEGKIKECLAIRDMYKFYKNTYDDPVEYKVYAKIIKACNKELIRQITKESEILELPYRLGKLQIARFDRSYDKPTNKLAVNWKLTKEHGFKVFHEDNNIYKWVWNKHHSIVINKTGYKFMACRFAKREVPKALKDKVEYFKCI